MNSTRRELAGFIGAGRAPELALRADTLVFAPGDEPDGEVARYWSEVDETVTAMQLQVTTLERLKARVSLASLRREDKAK